MKRLNRFLTLSLIILTVVYLGTARHPEIDAILTTTESFFKALKARDYKGIWIMLTAKSRARIVEDTYKAILKYNKEIGKRVDASIKEIERDFETGGPIAREYWDMFLENFNPDMVLEESKWEMGKIGRSKAEVVIQYKRSERPAILQVFKEDGRWRFGLMETFATSMRR
jgi:hypothetical protein